MFAGEIEGENARVENSKPKEKAEKNGKMLGENRQTAIEWVRLSADPARCYLYGRLGMLFPTYLFLFENCSINGKVQLGKSAKIV